MQNKKSVLFIEPENMLSRAKIIKKELLKQSDFAGIVIAEKTLRCLLKNVVFDKIAPEGSSLRKTYKKARKKVFIRKQEMMTYGDACGLPQKTMRNLLYRFVPDIVVVSTEEALRSVLVERKKLGIKCDVCVLFGEQPDRDLISDEVDAYFAEELTGRNLLVSWNVDAKKIVLGTSLTAEKEEEEDRSVDIKRSYGITKEKAVLYCVENCGDELAETIRMTLQGDNEGDFERLFMCGLDERMVEMITEYGERVVGNNNDLEDLIHAVDIVVADDDQVKEIADKYKKPYLELSKESLSFDEIDRVLKEKKPIPLSTPQHIYADYLIGVLENKLNVEPIEKEEEEPEGWTIQKDEDEE